MIKLSSPYNDALSLIDYDMIKENIVNKGPKVDISLLKVNDSSPYNDILSFGSSDAIRDTAVNKGIRGDVNYNISKDSAPYIYTNSPKR